MRETGCGPRLLMETRRWVLGDVLARCGEKAAALERLQKAIHEQIRRDPGSRGDDEAAEPGTLLALEVAMRVPTRVLSSGRDGGGKASVSTDAPRSLFRVDDLVSGGSLGGLS